MNTLTASPSKKPQKQLRLHIQELDCCIYNIMCICICQYVHIYFHLGPGVYPFSLGGAGDPIYSTVQHYAYIGFWILALPLLLAPRCPRLVFSMEFLPREERLRLRRERDRPHRMAETPEQRELQSRLQRERHRGRPAAQTSEARESMLEQR